MARAKDPTRHRAWFVFGPIALILTGFGWLALGLSGGLRTGGVAQAPRDFPVQETVTRIRRQPRAARGISRYLLPVKWRVNSATGASYGAVRAKSWREAQVRAAGLGARLVTIDDAAEQAWLVESFGGEELFWIGLTDANTEGRWRWAGGESVSYENWAADEPNNMYYDGEHFGVMNWRGPGLWNDMNPDGARAANVVSAIIERPGSVTRARQGGRDGVRNGFDVSGAPIVALGGRASTLPAPLTFDTGLDGWARWASGDASRMPRGTEIVWDHDRGSETIQFTRVGGGPGWLHAGVARDVHINLADYDDLRLSLDIKPMVQSLRGGGTGCDYPVTVELAYLDQNGVPHRWQHGFYMNGEDQHAGTSRILAKTWHAYTSPPLSSLTPICGNARLRATKQYSNGRLHPYDEASRPAVITRVVLYGSGGTFIARATNLRFDEGKRLGRASR